MKAVSAFAFFLLVVHLATSGFALKFVEPVSDRESLRSIHKRTALYYRMMMTDVRFAQQLGSAPQTVPSTRYHAEAAVLVPALAKG